MSDPTDDEIEQGLRAASQAQWDALWAAVAELQSEEQHATWHGGYQAGTTVVAGVERPVFQMPYAEYSDAVHRVFTCLGAVGAFVVFAWPRWDGLERLAGPSALEAAPVADAVRILTAVKRSERFGEGSIHGAIAEGTVDAALRRLRRWHDEHPPGRIVRS